LHLVSKTQIVLEKISNRPIPGRVIERLRGDNAETQTR
jgi:hypothetical protein